MKAVINKIDNTVKMVVHDKWTNPILETEAFLLDIPVDLPQEFAEVITIPQADQYWSKEGEENVIEDPEDINWIFHPEVLEHLEVTENVTLKLTSQMNAELATLKSNMVKDVYDQMEVVFGTTSDASASAFAQTWLRMQAIPSNFLEVLGVATDAEVLAYADVKVAEADGYAVYRLQRIATYETNKQTIIDSYGL